MPGRYQVPYKGLCKEPMFQYPNTDKPYTLFTGASHYAYSGNLTQAVESPDDLGPISYTSGSFSDIPQRWCTTEKGFCSVPICPEILPVSNRDRMYITLQS